MAASAVNVWPLALMMKQMLFLAGCLLVAASAAAQDYMYPQASGQCPSTHVEFQGVCISASLLAKGDTEKILRDPREFKSENPPPSSRGRPQIQMCRTKIDESNGDILKLENSAVVEVSSGFLGFVGFRKDALLVRDGTRWKIWIQGKRIFPVETYREPQSCSAPSFYPIQAAVDDEIFIINGETYRAQTYCLGWSQGESVVFLEGSEFGARASASLFNVDRREACDVWCE